MRYFTSDTHFNHAKIIGHCDRPYANVKDMNDDLVARWNSRVKKGDLVYHLGDFAWVKPEEIRPLLNGQIILIKGNHDRRITKKNQDMFVKVEKLEVIKLNETQVTLCHFPMRSWYASGHGAWHLHGHCHGTIPRLGMSLDVSADAHNYYPWSEHEIVKYFQELVDNCEGVVV